MSEHTLPSEELSVVFLVYTLSLITGGVIGVYATLPQAAWILGFATLGIFLENLFLRQSWHTYGIALGIMFGISTTIIPIQIYHAIRSAYAFF